jgi:hypothetical protein
MSSGELIWDSADGAYRRPDTQRRVAQGIVIDRLVQGLRALHGIKPRKHLPRWSVSAYTAQRTRHYQKKLYRTFAGLWKVDWRKVRRGLRAVHCR